MVKLVSSRDTRLYGSGGYHQLFEAISSASYIVGAVLLLAGLIFQLPNYDSKLGLVLALLGSLVIFLVDLHDLYAHLAGIDFRVDILFQDAQYILVELAVPVVSAIGSLIIFLAVLFLLLIHGGRYSMHTRNRLATHALRMLIAGPALWFIASIHNAFQVYERASLKVQAYERAVSICFIFGSTLLLAGGILGVPRWPSRVVSNVQVMATWLAIAGATFLVLGGIINAMRVRYLHGRSEFEPLRGGARDALRRGRGGASEPFVEGSAKEREDTDVESAEARPLYKDVVAGSPERLY